MVAMKIITAAVSYATAIAVYKLIPLALLIPSPIQLEMEINQRKAAQRKLQSRYQRSVVTNQVTREIRRNLQLDHICNATAHHCATLFNADHCTLYRYTFEKKNKNNKSQPPDADDGTRGPARRRGRRTVNVRELTGRANGNEGPTSAATRTRR